MTSPWSSSPSLRFTPSPLPAGTGQEAGRGPEPCCLWLLSHWTSLPFTGRVLRLDLLSRLKAGSLGFLSVYWHVAHILARQQHCWDRVSALCDVPSAAIPFLKAPGTTHILTSQHAIVPVSLLSTPSPLHRSQEQAHAASKDWARA